MRRAGWSLVLAGTAVAAARPGEAADGPRDVAALLRPIREKHDLPGMAGAIVSGDRVEAIGADGVRERGRDEKVTADDRWHLGSCTKSMTATLVGMLVEEKKLSFSTTVGEVFKDLKSMDAGWKDVTVEQLLTHHAGAPAGLDADGLWNRLCQAKGTPAEARRMLVEGVTKYPPPFKPGTKYVYSNAGVSIAGAMAETVMKEPWESLLAKRLFEPLGMTSAGFGAPGTAETFDQPRGHPENRRPLEPRPGADNPVAIGPAGIVHASIGDWAKYVGLHMRGERKETAKLLAPDTFVRLHTPVADDAHYAMGWIVTDRPWGGGRVLTHSGSNTIWFCVTWIAPERDFAVLVTCNQGGEAAGQACDEASWALIRDHLAHAK
jgi:CubicO group peptidase (beta-lactamase class C family)